MKHFFAFFFSAALLACSSDDSTIQNQQNLDPPITPPVTTSAAVTEKEVIETYAVNLYQAYADSVTQAEALQNSINAFLDSPNETTLAATRQVWLDSRQAYMQTEGARFYGGPIDDPATNYEASLNSWPLDEAYIDYTTNSKGVVDDTVGIINQPEIMPTITAESLAELNGRDGDENITIGYHAIEFLLWGQALKAVGPGERKATDYLVGPDGPRKNAIRRQTYLREVTKLLITTLTRVRDAWAPNNAENYRALFVTADPKVSLSKIIVGMGKMSKGELAGQRILASYLSKDRKDQHNCFSATTLIDYERNALGIQNMYLGRYGTSAGPGIDRLVQLVNAELHEKIIAQLQASRDALAAVPPPFEQAFLGGDSSDGRVKLGAVTDALRSQADTLVDVANALSIQINIPDTNE